MFTADPTEQIGGSVKARKEGKKKEADRSRTSLLISIILYAVELRWTNDDLLFLLLTVLARFARVRKNQRVFRALLNSRDFEEARRRKRRRKREALHSFVISP